MTSKAAAPKATLSATASTPSAYAACGDAGTPSLTDGTLGFRVRIGADSSPAGFKAAVFFGIDANNDGGVDLFVGINNSGSSDTIGIWNPGAGLNISPNTTTIVSTPLTNHTPTASNYHFAPVTLTLDPTVGTATAIDGGGQNDYFLSFSVPFTDVVTELGNRGITGINLQLRHCHRDSSKQPQSGHQQSRKHIRSGSDLVVTGRR